MNPALINLLSKQANCDVTTPYGAGILRNDIEAKTGEYISINTIKRMVGILEPGHSHRLHVMNIVALYLGFASWRMLEAYLERKISGFNAPNPFIDLESLPENRLVGISWAPDRRITLRHLEGKVYRVEESINSKLQPGDLLTLSQAAVGFPFYAGRVERDGNSLGSYTAASQKGISELSLIDTEE